MIRRLFVGFALAAAGLSGMAQASATRATLEELNACAAIADGAQRLACYDAAAPKLRATLNAATDEDRVTLFGLDLFGGGEGVASSRGEATRPEDFGKRGAAPETQVVESGGVITEITLPLVDVSRNGAGYDVFVLENGQVWRQKERSTLTLPRNVTGVKVTIRQGMLGAYYLKREGQNKSVPVERMK